jgi:ketosteroid isomerase-like protein
MSLQCVFGGRLLRRVLAICVIVAGGMVLAACGSNQAASATQLAALQKQADMYQIDQIEATWHKAASLKDVDLMMSLWADNATFQIGPQTYSGKDQIRAFVQTKAAPFKAGNDWVSDTPAYKIRITVNGDTGTLYFECHYVEVATRKVVVVVGSDITVRRIHGRWMITNSVSATPTLST